jgi:hypothetical protein
MDLLGFVKGSPAERPALNGLVHVSGGTGDTSFHGYMMLHEKGEDDFLNHEIFVGLSNIDPKRGSLGNKP